MPDLCIYSDLALFSCYSSSSSLSGVATEMCLSSNFSFNVCVASMLLVILCNTSCKFLFILVIWNGFILLIFICECAIKFGMITFK